MKGQSKEDPEDWKEANVPPVFKKDKKEDLGNYSLGSLTSVPWEGDRAGIFKHMKDKKLVKTSQHGFTKERSCLTNMIVFYNEMTSSVAERKAVDVVYLVFKKIFNTASRNTLLNKLVKTTQVR